MILLKQNYRQKVGNVEERGYICTRKTCIIMTVKGSTPFARSVGTVPKTTITI